MLVAASDPTLLGIAALLTALAGIASSIWGVIKSRKEGKEKADETLRKNLRDCRTEAEKLAEELHRSKMRKFDRES
jgi:uncharacterized protein HemX